MYESEQRFGVDLGREVIKRWNNNVYVGDASTELRWRGFVQIKGGPCMTRDVAACKLCTETAR
jgi:hypothetical protein